MFVTKSMTERKNLGFLKRNSLTSGFYFNSRTCPQFLKKNYLKKNNNLKDKNTLSYFVFLFYIKTQALYKMHWHFFLR